MMFFFGGLDQNNKFFQFVVKKMIEQKKQLPKIEQKNENEKSS